MIAYNQWGGLGFGSEEREFQVTLRIAVYEVQSCYRGKEMSVEVIRSAKRDVGFVGCSLYN